MSKKTNAAIYEEYLNKKDQFIPIYASNYNMAISTPDKSLIISNSAIRSKSMEIYNGQYSLDSHTNLDVFIRTAETKNYSLKETPRAQHLTDIFPFKVSSTQKTLETLRRELTIFFEDIRTNHPYLDKRRFTHETETKTMLDSMIERTKKVMASDNKTSTEDSWYESNPYPLDIITGSDKEPSKLLNKEYSKQELSLIELNYYLNLGLYQTNWQFKRRYEVYDRDSYEIFKMSYARMDNKIIIIVEAAEPKEPDKLIVYDESSDPVITLYQKSETGKVTVNKNAVTQKKYNKTFLNFVIIAQHYTFYNAIAENEDFSQLIADITKIYQYKKDHLQSIIDEKARIKENKINNEREHYEDTIRNYDPLNKDTILIDYPEVEFPYLNNQIPGKILPLYREAIQMKHEKEYKSRRSVHIAGIPAGNNEIIFVNVDKNNKPLSDVQAYSVYKYNDDTHTLNKNVYLKDSKHTYNNISLPGSGVTSRAGADFHNHLYWAIAQSIQNNRDDQPSYMKYMTKDYVQSIYRHGTSENINPYILDVIHTINCSKLDDDLGNLLESYVKQVPTHDKETLAGIYKRYSRKDFNPYVFDEIAFTILRMLTHTILEINRQQGKVATIKHVEDVLNHNMLAPGLTEKYTLKKSLLKSFNITKQINDLMGQYGNDIRYFPNGSSIVFEDYTLEKEVQQLHPIAIWGILSSHPDDVALIKSVAIKHEDSTLDEIPNINAQQQLFEIIGYQAITRGNINVNAIINHLRYLRDVESLMDVSKAYNRELRITRSLHVAILNWKDYIGMAHRIGYDLTINSKFYSKQLLTKHQEVNILHDILMSEAEYEAFQDVANKYKRFNAEFDKYIIRVAKDENELIEEGSSLQHCVSSYVYRMAKEQAIIFFLRKADDPDTPLVTIEVNPHSIENGSYIIRQQHGRGNRKTNATESKIINQWRKETLSINNLVM